MVIIDIVVIVLVIFFCLLGLRRGLWNSLFKLISAVLCIPLAILFGNILYGKLKTINFDQLTGGKIPIESIDEIVPKLREIEGAAEIFDAVPSLEVLIENWSEVFVKVLVIYLTGLVLFVAMILISNLLWHLLLKHFFPKDMKIRIGGVFVSLVQSLVIISFILMPAIIARPLVAKLEESEIMTEEMKNEMAAPVDYVDSSFSFKIVSKLASPFAKGVGKYTHEDKKYNAFGEVGEAIDVIDLGLSIKNRLTDNSDMFHIDFGTMNVIELRAALNNIGDELGKIDDSLNKLNQTSNVRNVTEELVIYLLEKLFAESGSLESVDLSRIDFSEKFNIKDQVLPLLFAEAIAQLETQYPFLAGYDLSSMTFDEIVNEIVAFAAAAALYNDINSIMQDINNINNIDPEMMLQYFEDIENSEIAQDLIENVISELAEDAGLEIDDVDFIDEGQLMARLMILSKSTDPNAEGFEEECIAVALAVSRSVATYQFVIMSTSPTKHMVTVNLSTYLNIQSALANADPAIDSTVQANVMNIYQVG